MTGMTVFHRCSWSSGREAYATRSAGVTSSYDTIVRTRFKPYEHSTTYSLELDQLREEVLRERRELVLNL